MSAASGGNSEPKQEQRSQRARGFCPRSTMRVPQPDIIEHFGNADAVPQLPERCLSRKAGIVRCCLIAKYQLKRESQNLIQSAKNLFGVIGAGFGVLGIKIGTDLFGVCLGQHSAAHHDLAGQVGRVQGFDGGLHVGHGGGHQG